MRARVRKAFTLVEILIVVVILGILAAIVVPQFTNATQDAQGGNIMSQLDTLNNQLELYRARNNGQNPPSLVAGGANAWDDLVDGEYLKAAPRNPACPRVANGANQSSVVIGAAAANAGWNFADNFPVGAPDGTPDTIEACYFDEDPTSATHGVTTTP
jgi:prepilin-type N-terminal cleavage/methylation domain-containing protein